VGAAGRAECRPAGGIAEQLRDRLGEVAERADRAARMVVGRAARGRGDPGQAVLIASTRTSGVASASDGTSRTSAPAIAAATAGGAAGPKSVTRWSSAASRWISSPTSGTALDGPPINTSCQSPGT
jgi:hypothetical protein